MLPAHLHAQCSIAAWTSTTGSFQAIGEFTEPVGKRYEGSCGLTVDAALAPGFVTTTTPQNESLVTGRFYFLAEGLEISSGDVVIFQARDGANIQVQLSLREVDNVIWLVTQYRTNGALVEHPDKILMQPVWQGVTFYWSTGIGTGVFALKLDGREQFSVATLSNDTEGVNEVDLGIMNVPSAIGVLVFDAIEIRRTENEPPLFVVNELFNISTRGEVLGLDQIMIAGFIIRGDTEKCVVLRGRGQSVGVPEGEARLDDPLLILKSGTINLETNDNWQDHPLASMVEALNLAPTAASDAAFFVCLPPGPYSALLRGAPGTPQGIGIVEVVDVDQGTPFLGNISTRAQVGTGNKIAIAGFIIRGDQPKTVLIRGRGPSVNVEADLLPDPRVILKDSSNTTLADNDNWKDAPNWQDIEATGKAPPNDLEAAILISLDPGPYTVRLQGTGGVVGVGIVEVLDQTGGSIVGN
jgi:hypothetical protein